MHFIPTSETHEFQPDGSLLFRSEQVITPDYIAELEAAKQDFQIRLDGYTPVCDVPEATWDTWVRQGIPVHQMSGKEILALLRKEEMTKFIICGDKTF